MEEQEKILSIIIPRYKETENEIFPLLSSISNQLGFNLSSIEIIIVNDGNEQKLNDTFLNIFNLNIYQIILKNNKGPGIARQTGLDKAVGKYVMFCDADDCLQNVNVLNTILKQVELENIDFLTTDWYEERLNQNELEYIKHTNEITWLHGKIFNRQFLVENNIKFHNSFRVHEDSYFLEIVMSLAKNPRYLPFITYVWKYNKNSITRINNAIYTYEKYSIFLEAVTQGFKYVEKYKKEDMPYKVIQLIVYTYFTVHRPEWQKENVIQYRDISEKKLVEVIKGYWHYWEESNIKDIAQIYNEERNKYFCDCIEEENLNVWLERIGLIE